MTQWGRTRGALKQALNYAKSEHVHELLIKEIEAVKAKVDEAEITF